MEMRNQINTAVRRQDVAVVQASPLLLDEEFTVQHGNQLREILKSMTGLDWSFFPIMDNDTYETLSVSFHTDDLHLMVGNGDYIVIAPGERPCVYSSLHRLNQAGVQIHHVNERNHEARP